MVMSLNQVILVKGSVLTSLANKTQSKLNSEQGQHSGRMIYRVANGLALNVRPKGSYKIKLVS